MEELIKLKEYPVRDFLKKLLQDKTTKLNIKFATSTYESYGYSEESQMTEGALLGFSSCDIQPRVYKSMEDQGDRTRKKAEVFTPAWVVNKMNNHCDSEWFERTNVFNIEEETIWVETTEKIEFPKDKTWKDYIDSRRLEITCGEAPFIVSRYDSTTGEIIPIEKRIGLLDRKLRVVNENAIDENEWLDWVFRAFQSVYGYEFQGDNLLLARVNLLTTFCDYLKARWNREATKSELTKIINIICWNFWQMDGLKKGVPFGKPQEEYRQLSLFGDDEPEDNEIDEDCLVYDWKQNHSKLFKDIEKRGNNMKFDFVIGNPPYQVEQNGRMLPVYDAFMDEAFKVADITELIHPARFLFNAGQTNKDWNKKILADKHFKVLEYSSDSKKYFSGVDIKGGVAISLRNQNKDFGATDTFIPYDEMRSVLSKVRGTKDFISFATIVFTSSKYALSNIYEEHPNYKKYIKHDGKDSQIDTNAFEKMPIFEKKCVAAPEKDCVQIYGRIDNQRAYYWTKEKYIADSGNLYKYKVFVSKVNGSGDFGITLSQPEIGYPRMGSTQSFLGIGALDTEKDAQNLLKYLKSKFLRAMLCTLKITQDNNPVKWSNIPLQDFTSNSDIDWSVSVAEIDKQLYKKYGLSAEEIKFIETNVKEME